MKPLHQQNKLLRHFRDRSLSEAKVWEESGSSKPAEFCRMQADQIDEAMTTMCKLFDALELSRETLHQMAVGGDSIAPKSVRDRIDTLLRELGGAGNHTTEELDLVSKAKLHMKNLDGYSDKKKLNKLQHLIVEVERGDDAKAELTNILQDTGVL